MQIDTLAAKKAIAAAFDKYGSPVRCYYEFAPEGTAAPYAVVKRMRGSDLEEGYSINFSLEVHADETQDGAAEEMERLCDMYQNAADGEILRLAGVFYGHMHFQGFDDGAPEAEYDLAHRTMTFVLRLFYL